MMSGLHTATTRDIRRLLLMCMALSQIFVLFVLRERLKFLHNNDSDGDVKYVGFHLNNGRMCNQLFHLVTGYGIARTLNRIHYIPNERYLSHVQKYLNKFKETFPLLHHSYTIAEDGINQTNVDFAGSCCAYDDPRRQRNKMMCIHTRQTDFVAINVATDANQTALAANDIARRLGIERFMIFGDDQHFMHQLSLTIIDRGKWREDAAVVSDFEEEIDLYLSSQLCRAFLLSAVTSTFGWWLAFFGPFQDAVYYVSDRRGQADKFPSKELFL